MKVLTNFKYIIVSSLFLLAGCAVGTLPELSMDSVSIYAEPDANQNSAIAVDLVMIYDEELVKTLGKMSASTYFDSSKQLLLDNPTLLDIWHWELVPGQIVQDFEPPQDKGDAFAAFVFANYLTAGDHRVKVAPTGVVKILLQKNDLRNLVQYDSRDMKMGTTMTDLANAEDGEDEDMPKIKLGPTKKPMQPCKKKSQQCKDCNQAEAPPPPYVPSGKPSPVSITPLQPIPAAAARLKRGK